MVVTELELDALEDAGNDVASAVVTATHSAPVLLRSGPHDPIAADALK